MSNISEELLEAIRLLKYYQSCIESQEPTQEGSKVHKEVERFLGGRTIEVRYTFFFSDRQRVTTEQEEIILGSLVRLAESLEMKCGGSVCIGGL